ncbi:MAG TPA: PqqD family protein [Gemmatimonadaceae bacterium]|nr:PqqD family protein [Gemmatimonadaceae bacterium]
MDHPNYPKSRHTGLLVDHVGDETIIYDETRQEAHSLNRSASLVWEHSDGARSVQQLAALIGSELGVEPDESVVEYALDKLANAHLLEDATVSRRDLVRKLTFAGAAAVALPAVLSIATPSAAMAASRPTTTNQNGQGQNQQ